MIEKSALLLVIPGTLFYLSFSAKQKLYSYLGIVITFYISMIAFPNIIHTAFSISEETASKLTLSILIVLGLGFTVYAYKKEAEAKKAGNPINLGKDFRSILRPKRRNIMFWAIIISYYIGMKIYL